MNEKEFQTIFAVISDMLKKCGFAYTFTVINKSDIKKNVHMAIGCKGRRRELNRMIGELLFAIADAERKNDDDDGEYHPPVENGGLFEAAQ